MKNMASERTLIFLMPFIDFAVVLSPAFPVGRFQTGKVRWFPTRSESLTVRAKSWSGQGRYGQLEQALVYRLRRNGNRTGKSESAESVTKRKMAKLDEKISKFLGKLTRIEYDVGQDYIFENEVKRRRSNRGGGFGDRGRRRIGSVRKKRLAAEAGKNRAVGGGVWRIPRSYHSDDKVEKAGALEPNREFVDENRVGAARKRREYAGMSSDIHENQQFVEGGDAFSSENDNSKEAIANRVKATLSETAKSVKKALTNIEKVVHSMNHGAQSDDNGNKSKTKIKIIHVKTKAKTNEKGKHAPVDVHDNAGTEAEGPPDGAGTDARQGSPEPGRFDNSVISGKGFESDVEKDAVTDSDDHYDQLSEETERGEEGGFEEGITNAHSAPEKADREDENEFENVEKTLLQSEEEEGRPGGDNYNNNAKDDDDWDLLIRSKRRRERRSVLANESPTKKPCKCAKGKPLVVAEKVNGSGAARLMRRPRRELGEETYDEVADYSDEASSENEEQEDESPDDGNFQVNDGGADEEEGENYDETDEGRGSEDRGETEYGDGEKERKKRFLSKVFSEKLKLPEQEAARDRTLKYVSMFRKTGHVQMKAVAKGQKKEKRKRKRRFSNSKARGRLIASSVATRKKYSRRQFQRAAPAYLPAADELSIPVSNKSLTETYLFDFNATSSMELLNQNGRPVLRLDLREKKRHA